MSDILDQSESEQVDIARYLAVVRRRRTPILISLLLGWLAVWALSWIVQPRYRSGTLILVEQPTMPREYVTPNINEDLQQRMQSITQQILSRTRLLRIIEDNHLYNQGKPASTLDDHVERMRKDIEIELVRDNQGRVNAFNVYYTARDPRLAQKVTSDLTDLFINENLEVRQRQSEDTTNFLRDQLEAARRSLGEQEEKIRQFKSQHLGELPTQAGSNLQILDGLQSQLRNEEEALNTAKQQRVYLQSLVNQYRSFKVSGSGNGGSVGIAGIDEEIDRLKSQLADLTSHYTERHPDVRKLKDQIAKTQRLRDQVIAQASGNASDTTAVDSSSQSPMLAQLESQLQSNQIEIANRERSIADVKAKVNQYQGRINQEPVREQQLADLTRGYDQWKATYDDLLKKKNESTMATSMELLQQGERFRVLDPPSLPLKPSFPNRLTFCAIGLVVGLALGILVAALLEMVDDRLYSEKEIKPLLPAPVICEIPVVTTPEEQIFLRRKLWREWALSTLVLGVIACGSLFSFFRG